MASTYLSTTSTSATLATKYTISFWIKKAISGADMRIFNHFVDANNTAQVYFDASNDYLNITDKLSGSTHLNVATNRKFRDPSAWMHIVIAADTTQSTAADRLKVYINGTQETSFSTSTYPSQDASLGMQTVSASGQRRIGSHNGGGDYLDGSLAHFHFIDGLAYPASTFGETDSTSGIWKPKMVPSVTYGNNGFFLKFENAGNLDLDSSGNNLTFATSGTLTQNIDTPSNNFCTCNSVITDASNNTFANGNTSYVNAGSYQSHAQGTLGMQSGKWYWEIKMNGTHGNYGVCENYVKQAEDPQNNYPYYFLYSNGSNGVVVYNNATSSSGTTNSDWTDFASGQIIGFAYDADNGKLYAHNNGTYYNSGNPAGGTGEVISGITPRNGGVIVPLIAQGTGSARTHNVNWGQGYFGTSAVSSANADANGIGIFEYSVPSGFYALCTKNLKEFS